MRITYTDGNVTVSGEDGRTWAVQIPRKALTDCTTDDLHTLSAQIQAIATELSERRDDIKFMASSGRSRGR